VMLDLHVAPGGQSDVPIVADLLPGEKHAGLWEGATATANRARTVELWRALATRYAGASSLGGYDLLNEPRLPKGVPVGDLAQLYADIVAAIRSVDPLHMVVLEGNGFARDFTGLSAAPDANAMFEFHEYALFNKGWNKPNQKALAPFLKLRTDSHLPLWLGEFGEDSAQWQGEMVKLMQDNQIGWSIWPWKRIELKNHHPVIQTITPPDSWKKLADWLVGAWFSRRPTPAEAEKAMSEMLQAIQTPNCREDAALERTLSGKQP
jgi:endoglucanase